MFLFINNTKSPTDNMPAHLSVLPVFSSNYNMTGMFRFHICLVSSRSDSYSLLSQSSTICGEIMVVDVYIKVAS